MRSRSRPEFRRSILDEDALPPDYFRHLLGGICRDDMTHDVWRRIQRCWDRRGWDGIPE